MYRIVLVQKIGWVMLLISLLFLAIAWIIDFYESNTTADYQMREGIKWLIETMLTAGIYLLIGGLIAEQIGRKKDE